MACGEELVFIELKKGKLFQSMETVRFSKIDTRECCFGFIVNLDNILY